MITAHVLNLARRADRREAFVRWNAREALRIEMVEAIDGRTLDRAALLAAGIMTADCETTSGGLGCACSHRMMWEHCVASGEPKIIFEDDVILRRDFVPAARRVMATLPAAWDIALLGYNIDSVLDVDLLSGVALRANFSRELKTAEDFTRFVEEPWRGQAFRLRNAFGLCAYAVSPRGAERLLRRCFPLSSEPFSVPALNSTLRAAIMDYATNAQYRDIDAYAVVPPLALSPNDWNTSDVARKEATP